MEDELNNQNIPLMDDIDPSAIIVPIEARDPNFRVPISETGALYNTLLKVLEIRDELTIALMGMRGNEKTTFINSLPAYFSHSSFADAYNSNNFVQLINYSEDIGELDTKSPKSYIFRWLNGKRLRIIDTPGIVGDAIDQIHLDPIINHLAKVGHIDVMLFLFKANDARATQQIREVMGTLMECYDKNFVKNFLFCFTFGLSCLFDIEDAKRAVQSVFTEWSHTHDVHIQLTDENCICVDNMPFKTLLRRGQCVDYTSNQACWEHSVAALNQLLLCADNLVPYETKNIRSILDTNKRLEKMASLASSAENYPTKKFLNRVIQFLRSMGINCVEFIMNHKWIIIGLVGVLLLGLLWSLGFDIIEPSVLLIIEIIARMRAYVEKSPIKAKVDVFFNFLNQLYEWVKTIDPTLVPNFIAECYRKLKQLVKDMLAHYLKCKKEASDKHLTSEYVANIYKQLVTVPHLGPLVMEAVESEPQDAQSTENDEIIIQLFPEETFNETNDSNPQTSQLHRAHRFLQCLFPFQPTLRGSITCICVLIILGVHVLSLDYRNMWTLAWFAFMTLVIICLFTVYCNAKAWSIQLKYLMNSIAASVQKKDVNLDAIMSNVAEISGTIPGTVQKIEETFEEVDKLSRMLYKYTIKIGDRTDDCMGEFQKRMITASGNLNLLLGELRNTGEIFGATAERAENNMHWEVAHFLNGICSSAQDLSNTLQENTNITREEILREARALRQSIGRGIENNKFKPSLCAIM